MCKRLFFLISIVLVLGLVGNASADLVARWTFDDGDATDSGPDGTHHGTLKQGDLHTSIGFVYDAVRDSNVLNCVNPEGHATCSVMDIRWSSRRISIDWPGGACGLKTPIASIRFAGRVGLRL